MSADPVDPLRCAVAEDGLLVDACELPERESLRLWLSKGPTAENRRLMLLRKPILSDDGRLPSGVRRGVFAP